MAENPTTNHDLDRPLVGSSTGRDSEDWGSELNNNFTVIDNKLVVVDQESATSNYTPFTDTLFYAYDTQKWFRGNGADWISDDTTGSDPTVDSLTVNTSATVNGSSVLTQADESSYAHIDTDVSFSDVDTPELNGIQIVTDASNLQNALNNNERVVIAGKLDVTGISPINVGQDRTLMGFGRFDSSASDTGIPQSDILIDDSANPTIHVSGNNARIWGIGLDNVNASGSGIRTTGYSTNISHCDISAQVNAISCDIASGAGSNPTEPRINFNRLSRSGTSNTGSIGVHISSQHDTKLTNNIINGFETGIKIDVNSAYVSGNHIYPYPAPDMQEGIRSTSNNHRIVNNRFEGSILGHGIVIGNYNKNFVIGNICQVENDDANGLFVDEIGGWLTDSLILGNTFQTYNDTGSGAGQGINMDNVTTFNDSDVAHNIIDGFTNPGTQMVSEAAGSGSAPTSSQYYVGQLVENSDDNTFWVKDSTGAMVKVDNQDLSDGVLSLSPQSAAPSSPTAGMVTIQDGSTWDPAATGTEELVVYINGTWTAAT